MANICFRKYISSSNETFTQAGNWVEKYSCESFLVDVIFASVLTEVDESISTADIKCYNKDGALLSSVGLCDEDSIGSLTLFLRVSGGLLAQSPYNIVCDIISTNNSKFRLSFELKVVDNPVESIEMVGDLEMVGTLEMI